VTIDEIFEASRDFVIHSGKALQELVGNVVGHVARPTFGSVEGDHPDRVAVLPLVDPRRRRRGLRVLRRFLAKSARAVRSRQTPNKCRDLRIEGRSGASGA